MTHPKHVDNYLATAFGFCTDKHHWHFYLYFLENILDVDVLVEHDLKF